MKKATVITGASGSGKSWLAKNLASLIDENYIAIDGRSVDFQFAFNRCNENTNCVLIDDINAKPTIGRIIGFISNGIYVERQCKKQINIKPKLVIVFDESFTPDDIKKLGLSFTRRIELIEMVNGIGHRIEL